MTELRENDVVRYDPPPKTGLLSGTDPTWCIEGMGVVRPRPSDGALWIVDTYWGGGGSEHVFELEQVDPVVLFNLDDYDELPRGQAWRWERYAPADRGLITRQHRLQRVLYIRKGAVEDHTTIVENAHERLRKAEEEQDYAQRRVENCQRRLDELLTEAGEQS